MSHADANLCGRCQQAFDGLCGGPYGVSQCGGFEPIQNAEPMNDVAVLNREVPAALLPPSVAGVTAAAQVPSTCAAPFSYDELLERYCARLADALGLPATIFAVFGDEYHGREVCAGRPA